MPAGPAPPPAGPRSSPHSRRGPVAESGQFGERLGAVQIADRPQLQSSESRPHGTIQVAPHLGVLGVEGGSQNGLRLPIGEPLAAPDFGGESFEPGQRVRIRRHHLCRSDGGDVGVLGEKERKLCHDLAIQLVGGGNSSL